MSLRQLIGCSAAALVGAGAILASVTATQAVTLPVLFLILLVLLFGGGSALRRFSDCALHELDAL